MSSRLNASPYAELIAAEVTEMPRSRSIPIQSDVAPAARFDHARQLHRAPDSSNFSVERGLAGIGVRDDRKRPPAQNLVGKAAHQSASAVIRMPALKSSSRTTTINCAIHYPLPRLQPIHSSDSPFD